MATRKMNPRSLENLRLGPASRNQGKVPCFVTILPETKAWLRRSGNISALIDELVGEVRCGNLVSVSKVEQLQEELDKLQDELFEERQRKIDTLRKVSH